MKLYYFPIYGRGEPARMALWHAGVEYEDVRIKNWGELKPTFEFNCIPVLELDDGTRLSQT